MNNIVLDKKYVGDIKGEFYVPSYQRGYRWGKDEVIRLLDDIYNKSQEKYCLQPVVVCKRENCYELVDGQQRLTTLYLIYKYMHNASPAFFPEPSFSLSYETREQSTEFLSNLNLVRQEENIDFWFIANAYKTIKEWFDQDLQMRVMQIFKYLKEDVRVIWYEVDENEDAVSLFTRLNIGKIPLTSAELVKAMFLSSGSMAEMKEKDRQSKQQEISLQWDNIERELYSEPLFYFLTNSVKSSYPTRIDLILDLIAGKPEGNKDKYYTFFKIDEMRKSISLDDIWKKIHQTFLILKDWFEDHELYHKIGYLIACGDYTLQDIFREADNKSKDAFKAILDGLIRESVRIGGNYAELSYEKTSEYKKISKLLLLFNVESVRRHGERSQWFPFDKFKYNGNGSVAWSLEHIHAQKSEGMRTQEVWKEWISRHIPSVKTAVGNTESKDELIKKMQEAVDKTELKGAEFEAIYEKAMSFLSRFGNIEHLHSISNLALLSKVDNAALNNSTFDVKRNEIVEMDKNGGYIPFCTKMVFLKYYTPSEQNQIHFWGPADRIAYIREINKILKDYLEEPIAAEKEEA